MEFDQSILIWHIATDLCHYSDDYGNSSHEVSMSKQLLNYVLHLLVLCRSMLPKGIGQIRFRDTCSEAMEFFLETSPIFGIAQACQMLLQVSTRVKPA